MEMINNSHPSLMDKLIHFHGLKSPAMFLWEQTYDHVDNTDHSTNQQITVAVHAVLVYTLEGSYHQTHVFIFWLRGVIENQRLFKDWDGFLFRPSVQSKYFSTMSVNNRNVRWRPENSINLTGSVACKKKRVFKLCEWTI